MKTTTGSELLPTQTSSVQSVRERNQDDLNKELYSPVSDYEIHGFKPRSNILPEMSRNSG